MADSFLTPTALEIIETRMAHPSLFRHDDENFLSRPSSHPFFAFTFRDRSFLPSIGKRGSRARLLLTSITETLDHRNLFSSRKGRKGLLP